MPDDKKHSANESPFSVSVPYTPAGMRSRGYDPPPSSSALWRWRIDGIAGVRTQTFLRGGRRYILCTAIDEFFQAVTTAKDGRCPPMQHSDGNAMVRAMKELAAEKM